MATPALPQFEKLEDAYVTTVAQIADHYEYVNAARGNASQERLNMGFTLADPLSRVPFLASRKVNIVFHFAEALWYLWGRSDLEMMAYYAPQMRSYSMDGKTLRGSAYGARLFRAPPGAGPSAFDVVLSLLREDPSTKRAVMTMFRPEELTVAGNLDVACVLAFQFFLRDGRLHAVCYMRANDADQGLLSDVFSFTLLQEFAARRSPATSHTLTATNPAQVHRPECLRRTISPCRTRNSLSWNSPPPARNETAALPPFSPGPRPPSLDC